MNRPTPDTTPEMVERAFQRIEGNVGIIRKRLQRDLTFSEKILFGHLEDPKKQILARGEALLRIKPDRVAMQDATAQMTILQFMQAGVQNVQVPSTIHCDHLIQAFKGSKPDMKTAIVTNEEVYNFLRSASQKYGIGFWEPGSGIIHQVVLEKYAFPGGLIIGTDSHTPNGGGLGMAAIGVGGADAAEVMAGLFWEVLHPKIIGVFLKGSINGWTSPKDVIIKVCDTLTVQGGTNAVVEYFGPGADTISCTGKGTICNMGAEHGATTSMFPYDKKMEAYLKATERKEIAEIANKYANLLRNDEDVDKNPENYYDRIIEIDLDKLEPHIAGPHTPDLTRPVSRLKKEIRTGEYPINLSVALIGSCTNSSYEDIERTVDVAKQALNAGIKTPITLLITPGSEQIYETIKRDGFVDILERVGAKVLANACGPCIGQWRRDDCKQGVTNAILTSYNRNFPRRNDGNPETLAFMASPEIVMAIGLSGRLDFDPVHDSLETPEGEFTFKEPDTAHDIPEKGFSISWKGYEPPGSDAPFLKVEIDPHSERLALLEPFKPWDGNDFTDLPILLKAHGKCTTDHISPAGPWLKFRGHLDKISDNMFSGAVNAFSTETGTGTNVLTGEKNRPLSEIARDYKKNGVMWVAIGDENYGEGSSREHAAMEPRYLGCVSVIARSFARIHQSNLKKQGIVPLTFLHPEDYTQIDENDKVSILGLQNLKPNIPLNARIKKTDGSKVNIEVSHTMTEEQIQWFRSGSALNSLGNRK